MFPNDTAFAPSMPVAPRVHHRLVAPRSSFVSNRCVPEIRHSQLTPGQHPSCPPTKKRTTASPTMVSTSTLLAEVLGGVFAIAGASYFVLSSSRRSDGTATGTTDSAIATAAAARVGEEEGGETEEEQGVTMPLNNNVTKQLIMDAVSMSSNNYNDLYTITTADSNGTSSSSSSPVFTSASIYVPESLKLKLKGDSEEPTLMTPIPQPWEVTSVGASVGASIGISSSSSSSSSFTTTTTTTSARYTTEQQQQPPRSLAEELDWAIAQVQNLGGGFDGVLMIDTRNYVILSQAGPLVSSSSSQGLSLMDGYGKLPVIDNLKATKVTESHRMASKVLENPAIKSFAKCRIGQTDVTMVLLSQVDDFLGSRERLILTSVCQKVEATIAAADC